MLTNKSKVVPPEVDTILTKKIHAMVSPLPAKIKTRTPKEKSDVKR